MVLMKKPVFITGIIFFILLVILSISYYLIMPNQQVIIAYPGKVTTLVIEGNIIEANPPIFEDNQVLLPIDLVKKYIDKNVFWDEKLKKIIITTGDEIIKMKINDPTVLKNNKPFKLKITPKVVSGVVYMPIDFMKDIYQIDVSFIKENNVVVIDYRKNIKKLAEVISKEAYVRQGMSIKSPIVKKVKLGESMWAFDEYEKWYKVRTMDGIIGYIQKKFIKITSLISAVYEEKNKTIEKYNLPVGTILKGKINLVWDYVEKYTPDMTKEKKIEGLDVISPTWFHLVDEKGTVENRGDFKYVKWAKKNGYKVWALFSNSFNPKITTKVLNNSEIREEVIRKVLLYAKILELDGINVDFENMYVSDKEVFSQFIREMASILRPYGLVVSVDVGVPGGSDMWSLCYDRKAIAEAADYVAVMTYDQHWATSPVSGSVAQLTWVEEKLKQTLQEVPPSKLLLGLPFYIREWKEEKGLDGKIKVTQNAVLSMEEAKQRIKENKAMVRWDEKSGQYYAEYKKGEAVYKLWLEDENSVDLKSSLVHKYGLAGVASWRRGYENEQVWAVLKRNLKENLNYYEWAYNRTNKRFKQ